MKKIFEKIWLEFEETWLDWGNRIVLLSIAIIFSCFVFFCLAMATNSIFSFFGEAGSIFTEYKDHQEVIDSVTAGTIIKKSVVNGHLAGNGGMVVNPTNGQTGVIIGNNTTYKPTEYRLFIQVEYVFNGETFQAEKYFCVPVDVYREYAVGDFFDSQNF